MPLHFWFFLHFISIGVSFSSSLCIGFSHSTPLLKSISFQNLNFPSISLFCITAMKIHFFPPLMFHILVWNYRPLFCHFICTWASLCLIRSVWFALHKNFYHSPFCLTQTNIIFYFSGLFSTISFQIPRLPLIAAF